jgi:hypothetical protein
MRALPCARLFSSGTLTIASMLPGVSKNYLITGMVMQCLTTHVDAEYVQPGLGETLEITGFALASVAPIILSTAMRTAAQSY